MATPVHNGLQIVPTGTAGAPSSGTWGAGTLITDSGGVMYRCTVGGTPGTWVAVGSGDLTTHEAAADPHTGYQKESEKGVAGGYLGLDASRRGAVQETAAANGRYSWQIEGGLHTDGIAVNVYETTANLTLFATDQTSRQDHTVIFNSASDLTATLPGRLQACSNVAFAVGQQYTFRNRGTGQATITLNAADITAGLATVSIEGATSITLAPGCAVTIELSTPAFQSTYHWRIVADREAHRILTNVEREASIYRSILPAHNTPFLLLTGVAYFVYLGRTTQRQTPKFVEFHVSTAGAGVQVAEVGFFSTPAAPNKAAQSLTKIVSTGTVDSLTAAGVKRNTAAFATVVQPGVHLWAGIRTAMATTQPTILSLGYDMSQGHILSTAAAGLLTGLGPFAGALIAANTAQVCPNLSGSLI